MKFDYRPYAKSKNNGRSYLKNQWLSCKEVVQDSEWEDINLMLNKSALGINDIALFLNAYSRARHDDFSIFLGKNGD